VLSSLSLRSSLAALLLFAASPSRSRPPFTVTLRLGREVIGPTAALDLVLPAVGARRVVQAGTRGRSDAPRVPEIWITLPDSPTTTRLEALARATSAGQPVTGTCEIVVAPSDAMPPTTYIVTGCFAKAVDPGRPAHRVTLGYATIRVS